MASQIYNNVTDELSSAVSASDTVIYVSDGSKFADPGDGNYTPLYLIRASDGAHEIVHITSVSGNDLEVTRSEEGTDHLVFNAGDTVQVRPTRQSLLDMDGNVKTSTGEQSISDALDRRVIYVDTIADLQALPTSELVEGQQANITATTREGEFRWRSTDKTSEVTSDPYQGIYVAPSSDASGASGAWERLVVGDIIYLAWFDPDTSGETEQETCIQSAVNLTPDHGTLTMKGLSGTILVDVPSGQSIARPRAVYIDHPMTLEGSPGLVTKVKDFCSAWLDYTGVIHVYQAESSDVTIDGVFVDANADNHYETDGSGNKFWEAGPELKRPPGGCAIYCPNGTPNLKNTVIENCDIYRPLGGVSANGSLGGDGPFALNDPSFLDGSLETNLVVGPILRNNTTRRARGNDVIFNRGVIDGEAYGNKSYNSMYHTVRFYTSTINCHAWDNHAYVDYDYLATGYNQTDLWYWRTDDETSGQYLIRRSGFRIGAGYTSTLDCSMTDNVIRYQNANPASNIIDADSNDAASFQTNLSAVKNVQMKNNKSYNSPFGGLFGIAMDSSDDGKETEGVVFSGNEIYGCFGRQVLFQGNNYTVYDNYFEDCTPLTIAGGIVRLKGEKIRYFKNCHKYNRAGGNNGNDIFEIVSLTSAGENEMFVSDNILDGHTGTVYTKSDAAVLVHGTDVGIKPALANGWTANGGDIILYLNCAGQVSVGGVLNGSAATSDTVLTLPSGYGSKENSLLNAAAIQTADMGDGIAVGETFQLRVSLAALILNRKGTNASRAGFMLSYQGDGRLFS